MTVRPARFADVPALRGLILDAYGRSVYREHGTVDMLETNRLFMQAIQRHGQRGAGGTCVFVAERNDGIVDGFIAGVLDRVYHVGSRLMASDIYFYVAEDGDPGHAGRLLDAFTGWAEANDAVFLARMGATDAIGDWRRTAMLYERKGYAQVGVIYERRTGSCPAS